MKYPRNRPIVARVRPDISRHSGIPGQLARPEPRYCNGLQPGALSETENRNDR
jgi:hypothetical protein